MIRSRRLAASPISCLQDSGPKHGAPIVTVVVTVAAHEARGPSRQISSWAACGERLIQLESDTSHNDRNIPSRPKVSTSAGNRLFEHFSHPQPLRLNASLAGPNHQWAKYTIDRMTFLA